MAILMCRELRGKINFLVPPEVSKHLQNTPTGNIKTSGESSLPGLDMSEFQW